jgi:hypothetical protein
MLLVPPQYCQITSNLLPELKSSFLPSLYLRKSGGHHKRHASQSIHCVGSLASSLRGRWNYETALLIDPSLTHILGSSFWF